MLITIASVSTGVRPRSQFSPFAQSVDAPPVQMIVSPGTMTDVNDQYVFPPRSSESIARIAAPDDASEFVTATFFTSAVAFASTLIDHVAAAVAGSRTSEHSPPEPLKTSSPPAGIVSASFSVVPKAIFFTAFVHTNRLSVMYFAPVSVASSVPVNSRQSPLVSNNTAVESSERPFTTLSGSELVT